MKIAYLGIKGVPSKGGAERVVEAIGTRLSEKHQISIYCNRRYTPKEYRLPDIDLIRIPCLPGKHLQPVSLFVLSALDAIVRRRFDLIHLHNAEAAFVVPALKLRYPVIATSHGPAYARDKWGRAAKSVIRLMDYFFVKFSSMLTSVSLPVEKEYETAWGREVKYIPNGVDENLPVNRERAAKILEAARVDGDFILFAAGRIDRTKGCHFLLEAFSRIDTPCKVVVVGDLSVDERYGRELRDAVDSRVRFIPFIAAKADLFGIVERAKLFVFPSTVEAMSMMLLETASLGVPLICSDIPANTAVMPAETRFFRSADVDDLGKQLKWALDHPAEMAERALRIREWVRTRYSWDAIAEEYHDLYRSSRN
jgi:glycosyltransferase involved in cell wall biosynthesis